MRPRPRRSRFPPYAIPCRPSARRSPPPSPPFPLPRSPDEFHVSKPTLDAKVITLERFTRIDANDEAYLAFSLDADLRSCFSWNTKQIFLSIVAEYESPFASFGGERLGPHRRAQGECAAAYPRRAQQV